MKIIVILSQTKTKHFTHEKTLFFIRYDLYGLCITSTNNRCCS